MRYWYHTDSESYFTSEDEDYDPSGDGMSLELDRVEYLTSVAVLKSAALNDGVVPRDNREAASEMVEQGVFGPTEDCLDEGGDVRGEYVLAVASARLLLRGVPHA